MLKVKEKNFVTVRGDLYVTEIEAPKTLLQKAAKALGLWRGQVVSREVFPNLVVTVGRNQIAALIAGESPNLMTYMAIGNGDGNGGANPPTLSDTALQNELARSAATVTRGTGSNANKITWEKTFPAAQGRDKITEVGIFDSASGGQMQSRVTFSPAKDNENNDLNLKYELTIGS